jgi:5-methyltetrahydrofolate--homocysteine methyltransferase
LFNTPPKEVPKASMRKPLLRERAGGLARSRAREQKAAINQFHIAAIAEHFRGTGAAQERARGGFAAGHAAREYIIEGSRRIGRRPESQTRGRRAPLDIINGPLMAGMAEVGRLFNNNELIVAEVLQSAEAMKAAVGHLEQFMEKADTEKRAKVMLATVKGDVHDIGKNLVEIILKNNGYDVINLGIKVPPEELIKRASRAQAGRHRLSGLLVKSAQQMVITASDLRDAGIGVPLLVGGAALSDKFTRLKIAPQLWQTTVCYAKDAMTGLRLMNELSDPRAATTCCSDTRISGNRRAVTNGADCPQAPAGKTRSPKVRTDLPIPPVAYLDAKFARCRI